MSWWARWRALRGRADGVLGINRRNLELVRRLNERRHFPLADDKLVCKQFLKEHQIPAPETIAVYEAFIQIREAHRDLDRWQEWVVKPSRGRGGQGILIADRRRDDFDFEHVQHRLAEILFGVYSFGGYDRAFVEERLRTHEALLELSSGGLPDVRVFLVGGKPVLAMLRLATDASGGRANLHQGGLGVGVDLDTGRTTQAVSKGRVVTRHPDNRLPLAGRTVPEWPAVMAIAEQIGAQVPLGLIGLDVAICAKRGAVVLELNARPGLEIQCATGLGLRARLLDAEVES